MIKIIYEDGELTVKEQGKMGNIGRMSEWLSMLNSAYKMYCKKDPEFAKDFKRMITAQVQDGTLFMSTTDLGRHLLKKIEETSDPFIKLFKPLLEGAIDLVEEENSQDDNDDEDDDDEPKPKKRKRK